MTRRLALLLLFLILLAGGCIRYSFSGSTLPGHIRSVSIPIFDNRTPRAGLEDRLRETVYSAFSSMNVAEIRKSAGDAELSVVLTAYRNDPYEFDAAGAVKTYRTVIQADVRFQDRRENKTLYEGSLSAAGDYSHASETEEAGTAKALRSLSEMIVNNTLSGW